VQKRLKKLKGDVQSVGRKCFNLALEEVRAEREAEREGALNSPEAAKSQ
jgi:hypothetical protein